MAKKEKKEAEAKAKTEKKIDDIKAEIESIKPEKSKEAGNIRSEITRIKERRGGYS